MSAPTPQNPGLLNWLLILGLGVVWGSAFMSVRLSLDGFAPWTVAATRVAIGGGALWLIAILMGQGLHLIRTAQAWSYVVVLGVFSVALPFAMLSWGQQYAASAFAGVAMGAVPLLVLPLVYFFSPEEGIGPRRIIGIGLGFVGLLLLIGPDALAAEPSDLEIWGRIAFLGATLCYASGSVITRRAPKMPPIAFAAATLIVAAIVLVPIALIVEGWPKEMPAGPSAALIYAALFPTALAAVIRVRVITTAGSLFMSITSYMVPLWSVFFGLWILNEELPANLYIALTFILAGIAISQWRALFGGRG
jgi:drug/metabolite transporter (DMT)-like permease